MESYLQVLIMIVIGGVIANWITLWLMASAAKKEKNNLGR